MLVGLFILFFGSLMCSLTFNYLIMVYGRFFQGVGAACSIVLVFVFIDNKYKKDAAERIISYVNFLITIASSLSPIFGSFITHYFGWRINMVVIGLISLINFFLLRTNLKDNKKDKSFSPLNSWRKFIILLLDKKIFTASSCPSLLFAVYISCVTIIPFYYYQHYNMGITEYGIHQAFIISSFSLASIINGRFVSYGKAVASLILSVFVCIFSMSAILIMILMKWQLPALITFFLCIYSVGFAVYYPRMFVISMNFIALSKTLGASIIMTKRALIVSLSLFFSSFLYEKNIFFVYFQMWIMCIIVLCFTLKLRKYIK